MPRRDGNGVHVAEKQAVKLMEVTQILLGPDPSIIPLPKRIMATFKLRRPLIAFVPDKPVPYMLRARAGSSG